MKEKIKKIVIPFFNKTGLLVSTVALAIGFLFLFFGGTWEGVRFALELFGAIYILQICYSVVIKNKKEKQNEENYKKIKKKYFEENER